MRGRWVANGARGATAWQGAHAPPGADALPPHVRRRPPPPPLGARPGHDRQGGQRAAARGGGAAAAEAVSKGTEEVCAEELWQQWGHQRPLILSGLHTHPGARAERWQQQGGGGWAGHVLAHACPGASMRLGRRRPRARAPFHLPAPPLRRRRASSWPTPTRRRATTACATAQSLTFQSTLALGARAAGPSDAPRCCARPAPASPARLLPPAPGSPQGALTGVPAARVWL